MHAQNRTRNSTIEILERIENGEELCLDELKGIVGRSVLLDIPEFNYVYDAPAEYMHLTCLGVIKRLILLTFDVGETKTRNTKRKLSSADSFNILMLKT